MRDQKFTLVTLVDDSLAGKYFHRDMFRTYRRFDRFFQPVDIRKYQANENNSELTLLDRFAMFAVMYYEGISYERLVERLAGTKNLVFITSDLHYWSIFPQSIEPDLFDNKQLSPSTNRYDQLFEMFNRLDIRHLITSYECPEIDQIRLERPALRTYVIEIHIDPVIFRDYGLPKEYDIIIYGSMLPSVYPFRHRVCRLLTESSRFNILHLDLKSPFYDIDICGEGLARKINQSWLGLTTTSNFDYLLGKYFELPACRCVVLGNMNDQGKVIFGSNYIHIDDQMTDSQILGVVAEGLSNQRRLREYADEMYRVMHVRYTLAQYEWKLFKVACQILDDCRD